jgi:hypothetical protein
MMLGDLLARFTEDSVAAETIVQIGGVVLLARLREQAEADGLTLGAYSAGAVRRYAAEASEEEWVTLMGALSRARDPGIAWLQRAFADALARPHQSVVACG